MYFFLSRAYKIVQHFNTVNVNILILAMIIHYLLYKIVINIAEANFVEQCYYTLNFNSKCSKWILMS